MCVKLTIQTFDCYFFIVDLNVQVIPRGATDDTKQTHSVIIGLYRVFNRNS